MTYGRLNGELYICLLTKDVTGEIRYLGIERGKRFQAFDQVFAAMDRHLVWENSESPERNDRVFRPLSENDILLVVDGRVTPARYARRWFKNWPPPKGSYLLAFGAKIRKSGTMYFQERRRLS